MMANRIANVTTVSATAINGEAIAIVAERSGRRSSTNCIFRLLAPRPSLAALAPPINKPSRSRGRRSGFERRRQLAVKHHRNAVGNLSQFIEVLADHQHGALPRHGKIDQRLDGWSPLRRHRPPRSAG